MVVKICYNAITVCSGLLVICLFYILLAVLTVEIVRLQGTDEGNQHSVIESLPAASLLQTPGARADAATWCDEAGHVWLFGGEGYDDNATKVQPELLSDLWLLNTSRLEWNMMHSGTIQCTLSTSSGQSKSSKDELCRNNTSVAPQPRKRAASCGVAGIVFVVFGGIDSKGSSLSDTWIYIIPKARWLPLSRNVTKSVHPPTAWSTKSSWCDLDALYVIGSSTDNVIQMWKLSLRTLEWSNESVYLTEQQHCTYDVVPLIQPAIANSISIVWNATFYLCQWQIVHSDSSSLSLSVGLRRWHLLPSTKFISSWHSTPFLWSDLNLFNKDSGSCSSSYEDKDNSGHSCNLHRCYKITTSSSWPEQRLYISAWFYKGNMYIFGGQAGDSKTFFNDLCILEQSNTASGTNYTVFVLSLVTALVTFIVFCFGAFCISRYCDYQLGRKKSRELRIRYVPLTDQTLYE